MTSRRILLVNPPFYRMVGSHYNGLPIGIGYIASFLNRSGHEAWVYNADFFPSTTYKTLHGVFEEFREHADSFHECGPIIQQTVDAIVAFEPDIVGFSCYTATIPVVATISHLLRLRCPGVIQVAGGPHVTLDERPFSLTIDCNVAGEGEGVLRAIADGHDTPIPNRVGSGRIKYLDELPWPERNRLWSNGGRPVNDDERRMIDVCSLSTARGCPWRCHYCASPSIWPKVVARGVDNVVREVETIRTTYLATPKTGNADASAPETLAITDNTSMYIIDDTFTYNEQRAMSILRGICGLGGSVPWKCEARADTITPGLAAMMAKSGCIRVKMGVESGSDRILASINKRETTADMVRAVEILRAEGIPVTAYLMAGFPGETVDDLRATIDFARRLNADYYSISMVAPYYGTKLYRDALNRGLPVDKAPWECFFHHNDAMLLNRELPMDMIEELWGLCDVKRYV